MPANESKDLERLATALLERLETDAAFATRFDKDPAAACQSLYPPLANVPKEKIERVFQAHQQQVATLFSSDNASAPSADPVLGAIIRAATKALTKVASTTRVRAVATQAAKVVAQAVAVEAITAVLTTEEVEPLPE